MESWQLGREVVSTSSMYWKAVDEAKISSLYPCLSGLGVEVGVDDEDISMAMLMALVLLMAIWTMICLWLCKSGWLPKGISVQKDLLTNQAASRWKTISFRSNLEP